MAMFPHAPERRRNKPKEKTWVQENLPVVKNIFVVKKEWFAPREVVPTLNMKHQGRLMGWEWEVGKD